VNVSSCVALDRSTIRAAKILEKLTSQGKANTFFTANGPLLSVYKP
jgi:hypothetical protein